jgi:large subunit ribosomal protein L19e
MVLTLSYHSFYMKCKGNQFKNKYVLIESIHKAKNEEKRKKELDAQAEAKKGRKKKEDKKPVVAQPEAPKAAPDTKSS